MEATSETANETTNGSKAQACALRCRVCGRRVRQKPRRGRTKEIHTSCTILASRLSEIETLLKKIQFADREHVSRLRGDLFQLRNVALSPRHVTVCDDSDEDM